MSSGHHVIAHIPDLMAEVRFAEAMRAAGLPAAVLSATEWQVRLAEGQSTADSDPPRLAVVDLTSPAAMTAVESAVAAGVPVLAYGPHVQADLLGAAREAGAALVVPRGRFVKEAAALVRQLLDTAAHDDPQD